MQSLFLNVKSVKKCLDSNGNVSHEKVSCRIVLADERKDLPWMCHAIAGECELKITQPSLVGRLNPGDTLEFRREAGAGGTSSDPVLEMTAAEYESYFGPIAV